MSDVNFENGNSLDNFPVITKTTIEYGQVEANPDDISSLLHDEFPKPLKACAEAWGIHTEHLQ